MCHLIHFEMFEMITTLTSCANFFAILQYMVYNAILIIVTCTAPEILLWYRPLTYYI